LRDPYAFPRISDITPRGNCPASKEPDLRPAKASSPPDWFPLPIYQQDLTREQWLTEVALRAALQTAETNRRNGVTSRLTYDESPQEIFDHLFVSRKSRSLGGVAEPHSKNIWPVREPTAFEAYFVSENQRSAETSEAESWAKRLNEGGKAALVEFISSGARERMGGLARDLAKEPPISTYLDVLGRKAPIMVDLDHDDETLELAFKVWLADARDVLKEKAPKPVGDRELAKWKKFGLLPAFDLIFWSRVTGGQFTEAHMGRLIWPDTGEEYVDLTERFRKVTRPMVDEVFSWNFVNRFWCQIELEKSLDVVVAGRKTKSAEMGRQIDGKEIEKVN
jgi:Family of unknown function (DUF6387)